MESSGQRIVDSPRARWTVPASPAVAVARRTAVAGAVGALAVSILGLAGWVFEVGAFKSFVSQQAVMKPNSAVCLLLLSLGLRGLAHPQPGPRVRAAVGVCAATAAVIAGTTLLEYGLGRDLGVDQLLFLDRGGAPVVVPPGRMALNTATGIALESLAQLVLLASRRRASGIAQIVSFVVALVGLLRLYGFVNEVSELERFGQYTGMALPTAIALTLLGIGSFLARPGGGPARLVTQDSTTAVLGQRMLVVTLMVPPALGWLGLRGHDLGWYGTRLGFTLLVTGNIVVTGTLVFLALATADRLEQGRSRAERAVRAYAQLRTVMDHTPAIVFLRDLRGRCLAANSQFERVFGSGAGPTAGITGSGSLPGPVGHRDQLTSASRRPIQFESTWTSEEGTARRFLTSLFPVADESGETYAVGGVSTDITERAEAQREQERLQQRFRALLEAAPDAVVIVDRSGSIVLVNAQTETMFGYTREELLGRTVELLVPEHRHRAHVAHRTAFVDSPVASPLCGGPRLHGRRKNGEEFPVETALNPLRTDEGVVVIASIRDVTARRRAESQLIELAAMVESCEDAMVSVASDRTFTFWNAAAQRIFGYRPDEAIGRSADILLPAGREDETARLLLRLRDGDRIDHFESVRRTKDGRLIDVELTVWPTVDHTGTVVGTSASIRDISDRKRQEARRRQQYERQRTIASTLQRGLMTLPPQLPAIPTSVRYLPSLQGAGMGGDWFDLIPLAAGRVGILVGDVMGRGLEAAAVMGQLRPAAHALAKARLSPQEVMQALDTVVQDLADQIVTCCYLVIDLVRNEITLCSAGHLPLLLVTPDTQVRQVQAPISVPLGVGGVPHRQTTVEVPAGSALVLYTDGLVESHHHDLETGLKTLETELQAGFADNRTTEDIADHLVSTFIPDPAAHDDDVTLLITRLPAATATVELPLDARAAAIGRDFLSSTWRTWQWDHPDETARLLVSELVTNAVQHGRSPVSLHIHRSAWELTVEVTDAGVLPPRLRAPADDDESGRGLLLVDALADHWGTRSETHGKTIWFTLRLPVPPSAAKAASAGPRTESPVDEERARARHHPER